MKQIDTNKKFSNAKVGDKVYNILLGEWGTITNIEPYETYGINVEFSESYDCYTFDGKIYKLDNNPVLFWNEVKLPTAEEDKPPFNLEKFILENLEPTPYEMDRHDELFTIFYSGVDHDFYIQSSMAYIPRALYFKSKNGMTQDDILSTLRHNAISWWQLDNAYNKLCWI